MGGGTATASGAAGAAGRAHQPRASATKRQEKDEPPRLPQSGYLKDPATHKLYRLGKLLGKGGFAFCYEGRVEEGASAGEAVAVKVIPKTRLVHQRHVDKVHREIRLHASVKHPHIVQLVSSFEDPANIYILLELCQTTLVEVVRSRGKVTEVEAAYYLRQLLLSLEYLHSPGVDILHRDVKLGNVLLSHRMEVKLADFGLASEMDPLTGRPPSVSVCGTPNYISPELLAKQGHSVASDMWALGCTLYACLVGRPPFETSSIDETYQLISSAQFALPAFLSSTAKDLVQRLLALQPHQRPTPRQALDHPFLTAAPLPHTLLPQHIHRPMYDYEYKQLIALQAQQAHQVGSPPAFVPLNSPPGLSHGHSPGVWPPSQLMAPPPPPNRRVVWAPGARSYTSPNPGPSQRSPGSPGIPSPTAPGPPPLAAKPQPPSHTTSAERLAALSIAPLAKVESVSSLAGRDSPDHNGNFAAAQQTSQTPPPLPPRLHYRQSYQAAVADPCNETQLPGSRRGSPTNGLGNGLRSSPPPVLAAKPSAPVIRRPMPPSPTTAPPKEPLEKGLPDALKAYLHKVQAVIGRASSRKEEMATRVEFEPLEGGVEAVELSGRRLRSVQRWIDYTNKYGFGVQLCDGSVSVAFLDGSRLTYVAGTREMQAVGRAELSRALEPDAPSPSLEKGGENTESSRATGLTSLGGKENSPRYRLSRGDSGLGSSEELTRAPASSILPKPLAPEVWPARKHVPRLSRDLEQKVEWLGLFQHYMRTLEDGAADADGPSGWPSEAPFLLYWHRLQHSVILLLSDGTVQINFLDDHRKLTLRLVGDEVGVLYVDSTGARFPAKLRDRQARPKSPLASGPASPASPGLASPTQATLNGLHMDAPWRKVLRDATRLIHDRVRATQ